MSNSPWLAIFYPEGRLTGGIEEYIGKLPEGEVPMMPAPEKVRIRMYSIQSTHTSNSSYRGLMIHFWDE